MPDPHYDEALEYINALLQRIEGVEIPASADADPYHEDAAEVVQDLLSAVAEKLIILRDRMTGEDGSYTVGG